MGTITAKFAGQCKACGGSFPAGAQIEWNKGAGSKHVKCPEKRLAAAQDVAFTISLDFRGYGKPSPDSEVGRTFRVASGEHKGKVVTALTQRATYQSAEDNEDMGDMRGGGWHAHLGCRLATPEETAKLVAMESEEQAKKDAARVAKDAEKAALEAEKARLTKLTDGLVRTESFSHDVLATEPRITVAQWSEGASHFVRVEERRAITGETVYVVYSHDYDDDRSVLYATREVVEASWAKLVEKFKETPEAAREFLAKYNQCVGADWRRWFLSTLTSVAA